jgi:hypothetical protein
MSTKVKKKLCWNCEGDVMTTATQCPFCGVSLDVPSKDPFAPPYKLSDSATVPDSPYSKSASAPETKEETLIEREKDPRSIVLSLVFMLTGAAFALFSMVLWLFSEPNGYFTLRWNGSYWFVYLFISLPLLYLGWRASESDEDEE